MTNQRSPLDSLNTRRERRPLASIEELNRTLSALESQLLANKQSGKISESAEAEADALEFLRQEQPQVAASDPARLVSAAPVVPASNPDNNPHKEALAAIAEELQRLRIRTELRQATSATADLHQVQTQAQAQANHQAGHERVSATERFISGTSRFTTDTTASHNTDNVMRRDLEELKRTVETLAREESLRRMSHRWDALDERFDNFEQKQSEKLQVHTAIDPALDTISARLEDLRHSVEQLPYNQSHSLRQLDERLDEISRAILATSYNRQQPEQELAVFGELDRRFAELTRHLDEQYHQSAHKTALNDDRFIQALEDRLDNIARQVNEQTAVMQAAPLEQPVVAPLADQQLMRNLEKQLGLITEHLSNPESLMPELAEIKPRLDTIERAIDMNRDMVLGAAREAAEEAIRQVVGKGSASDTGFARQLADDLKSLELLTRESDERNSRTFDRVHDTLLKIADRLGQIEKDTVQKPPHTLAARALKQREQDKSERFTNQFSIPEWGNPGEQGTKNPFSELRGNPSKASPYSAVPSPAAAAIEAARAAIKANGNTDRSNNTMRGPAEEFTLEDSELLTLEPATKPTEPELRAEPSLSAMPDLNAIIRRVRDEQRERTTAADDNHDAIRKSDLISAARRAVQVATDETGRLRDEVAQTDHNGQLGDDVTADADRTSASGKPKRSLRKPLLLAIGAIIMAVTGLQLGSTYLSEPDETLVPLAQAPVQAPAQAQTQTPAVAPAPAISEDKKPSLPTMMTVGRVEDVVKLPAPDETGTQPLPKTTALPDSSVSADEVHIATAQPQNIAPDLGTTQSIAKTAAPDAVTTDIVSAIPAVPEKLGTLALRTAAADGDARALYEIGMRYMDGRGVESDFAKAAQWYALSAERGFAPAQYRLGNFNEKGLGLPRDAALATKFYEQAAAQGNASAMHNLAVLYAMGADGAADNDKAAKWFFKAAELGIKDSQYNLGILTAKGLGRTQSLEESYKWFALAANAGDKDAAEKRDQVAASLKPEQLERAINLTKLWKPKDMIEEANNVLIPDAWVDNQAVTTASVDMVKAVRNIQLILHKNGYDAGTPDGIMGAKTRQAISAFQKANGMKPTGEIDQPLVEVLLSKNS